MICSNCGHEFDDSKIFCPNCGTEVHIVPEFVPEIEQSIEESIQNIVTDVIGDEGDKTAESGSFDTTTDLFASEDESFVKKAALSKFSYIYIGAAGLIIVLLLVFLVVMFYRDNSSSYNIKCGDKAYAQGEYKKATDSYKKASQLDPTNPDILLKIADCYKSLDNVDMAIDVYKTMIDKFPDSTLAFSSVISIYEENGDYDEIDVFLKEYADEDMKKAFVDYLAYPPVFSHDDGSYDSAIILTITSDSEGKIYYTDDGSKPDTSSKEYSEPIMLKKGKHMIQAVFVNKFGVMSPVMTHSYIVLAEAPSPPMVSLDSGVYDTPQLVRVIVPEDCYVYYTLDGTEPDSNSRIYGEPITVSDGVTVIKLVAINSRGVKSETVEKEYSINVEKMFEPEVGIAFLKNHLVTMGYITDISGTSAIYPGRFDYLYSEMRYIGGRSLYCYNEYYLFGSGAKSMTGNIFALDCTTGEVFLLKRSSTDVYSISPF